jgi:hypothetical protein
MFQNFLLKTMLKKQLKDVPQEQQDIIMAAVEKNPDLFIKIAKEVQEKTQSGMNQQDAIMQVMQAHQEELRVLIGK